jgi:Leucine-rich repeat (LRR) protein
MTEMAAAIMVVSLPSMRSFLRRGTLFSSNKKSRSSDSRTYGPQTPASGSHNYLRPSKKGRHSVRVHTDDDSGSEVELNTMGRKDVIYETRRVSVQFSNS